MYAADRASRGLGITIHAVAPGRATARMALTPQMLNGHALVHGGYIFALADTAFAFACNTYGEQAVARDAQISFVAPGRAGDALEAIASERYRRGRRGIYDVTVRGADGTVIAELRGHSQVVDRQLVHPDGGGAA